SGPRRSSDCLSTVRLPLWAWLLVVRVGFTLSLCESVVDVQDWSASPVWESEVCAQSARPEQKYAPIASSRIWLERGPPDDFKGCTSLESTLPSSIVYEIKGFQSYPAESECGGDFVASHSSRGLIMGGSNRPNDQGEPLLIGLNRERPSSRAAQLP